MQNKTQFLTLIPVCTALAFFEAAPAQSASGSKTKSPPPAEAEMEPEVEPTPGEPRGPSLAGDFIAIGPGFLGNLNSTGMGYSLSGGHAWDMRGAMLTLLGDITLQGDALMMDGGIGARFFPSEADTAPYLGGFFGVGASKDGGGGLFSGALTGGFAAGADAGVQLFRTSDIHLELGASFRILMSRFETGAPWGGLIRVGLFF
jgi:hypothetical protein